MHLTVLQDSSVAESTRKTYLESLRLFEKFVEENNLALTTHHDIDFALCLHFEHLFLEGEKPYMGSRLLAALCWSRPALGHLASFPVMLLSVQECGGPLRRR